MLVSSLIMSTILLSPLAPSAPIAYITGLPIIEKSAPKANDLTISLPLLIPLSKIIGKLFPTASLIKGRIFIAAEALSNCLPP